MLKTNGEYSAEYSYCSMNDMMKFDPIEMYDVINGNEEAAKKVMALAGVEVKDTFRNVIDSHEWLPFAAEKLKISSKLSDYVIVPTSIMPTELPNRNGVGFPFEELTAFNHEHGKIAYKTWQAKSCFQEHKNNVVEESKGVILDAAMRPLSRFEGNIWQVILLNSFDRTKDAHLANSILKKEATGYSMGAWVRDYECSICATSLKETNGKGCQHVNKKKPEFAIFDGKLAYYRAIDPVGFECSSVAVPAYVQAVNPDYLE